MPVKHNTVIVASCADGMVAARQSFTAAVHNNMVAQYCVNLLTDDTAYKQIRQDKAAGSPPEPAELFFVRSLRRRGFFLMSTAADAAPCSNPEQCVSTAV